MPQQIQQTRQFNTSQDDTLIVEFTATHCKDHCYFDLNQAAQRPLISNMENKELNVSLWAKEQGDDAPLPAFQRMRLINWLSAVVWAGEE